MGICWDIAQIFCSRCPFFPFSILYIQPTLLSSLQAFSVARNVESLSLCVLAGKGLCRGCRLCLAVSFPSCPWVIHTAGSKMPTGKLMEHSPTPGFLPKGACLWGTDKSAGEKADISWERKDSWWIWQTHIPAGTCRSEIM